MARYLSLMAVMAIIMTATTVAVMATVQRDASIHSKTRTAQPGRRIKSTICRALALGGGGDWGAFEAGAFAALVDTLPADEVRYDVVSGISAGAINAAAIAQYKKGEERAAKDFLLDQWRSINRKDVWKNWVPGSVVEGFFLRTGLLDSSPLQRFLESKVDLERLRHTDRLLHIGAMELDSGEYRSFNQTHPNIIKCIMASSAIPGVFPTIDVDGNGNNYVDGGAQYMVPVSAAVRDCIDLKRSQGHNPNDVEVHVDVILSLGAINYAKLIPKEFRITPFVLGKSFFAVLNNIFAQDVQNARINYPDAKIRVIQPSEWMKSYFLFFNNCKFGIQLGYKDALRVIKEEKML